MSPSPRSDRGAFPDFLIVGAQKSGTRWLRRNLDRHPSIFMASGEPSYFDRHFDQPGVTYWNQFAGNKGAALVGEATPGYMMWPSRPNIIAARIDGMLPGVLLMAILRNPIDRTVSAFRHHRRYGRIAPQTTLREAVTRCDPSDDPLGLISGSWYAASLQPYVRRFGSRLAVFVNEAITGDGGLSVYEGALRHIGAGAFTPEGLGEVLFSNTGPDRGVDEAERELLHGYLSADVRRLRGMIDADFGLWSDFA